VSLPAEPASASVARRFVRDSLDAWGAGGFEEVAVLLTSELVTNALLHARSAPELNVRLVDGRLRITVADHTPVAPVRKRYGKEAATGRGLLLIETMANAWGTEPSDVGKVVWFELSSVDGGRADESIDAGLGSPPDLADGVPDDYPDSRSPNRRRPPGGPRASMRRPQPRLRRPSRP